MLCGDCCQGCHVEAVFLYMINYTVVRGIPLCRHAGTKGLMI